jgi:hypothetical protein
MHMPQELQELEELICKGLEAYWWLMPCYGIAVIMGYADMDGEGHLRTLPVDKRIVVLVRMSGMGAALFASLGSVASQFQYGRRIFSATFLYSGLASAILTAALRNSCSVLRSMFNKICDQTRIDGGVCTQRQQVITQDTGKPDVHASSAAPHRVR